MTFRDWGTQPGREASELASRSSWRWPTAMIELYHGKVVHDTEMPIQYHGRVAVGSTSGWGAAFAPPTDQRLPGSVPHRGLPQRHQTRELQTLGPGSEAVVALTACHGKWVPSGAVLGRARGWGGTTDAG